jgi:hypothetical protein
MIKHKEYTWGNIDIVQASLSGAFKMTPGKAIITRQQKEDMNQQPMSRPVMTHGVNSVWWRKGQKIAT